MESDVSIPDGGLVLAHGQTPDGRRVPLASRRESIGETPKERPTIMDKNQQRPAAAAEEMDTMQEERSESEENETEISRGDLRKEIFAILDRLCRDYQKKTYNAPVELLRQGLPYVFWLSLDAKGRHWIKRRIGTFKTTKLLVKTIYMALQKVQQALHDAGITVFIGSIMSSLEGSHLVPWSHQDPDARDPPTAWDNHKLPPEERGRLNAI